MISLRSAFNIIRFEGSWSVRRLAAAYQFTAQPLSLRLLIQHVLSYSSIGQVEHFFVLMLENRSFDHMLGFSQIKGVNGVTGVDTTIDGLNVLHLDDEGGRALESNRDALKKEYPASCPAPSALQYDPPHHYPEIKRQLANGNSGFVKEFEKAHPDADPGLVMKCMHPSQVSILTALAREFAVCDAWFASGPLETGPNRLFVHAATAGGYDSGPSAGTFLLSQTVDGVTFENGTIFDRFDEKSSEEWAAKSEAAVKSGFAIPDILALIGSVGRKWQIYADGTFVHSSVMEGMRNTGFDFFADLDDLEEDLARDEFPYSYAFIEPQYYNNSGGSVFDIFTLALFEDYGGGNSDHPTADIGRGQALIARVYNAIRTSKHWAKSALIITYDEHGGFYDHVPPPEAVPPGDSPPGDEYGFAFDRLGPRVPAIVISPLIPRNTVDHTVYDHTSILKSLEERFDIAPLTKRDEAAHGFGHLFRLRKPRQDALVFAPLLSTAFLSDDTTPIENIDSQWGTIWLNIILSTLRGLSPLQRAVAHQDLIQVATVGELYGWLRQVTLYRAPQSNSAFERDRKGALHWRAKVAEMLRKDVSAKAKETAIDAELISSITRQLRDSAPHETKAKALQGSLTLELPDGTRLKNLSAAQARVLLEWWNSLG